MPDEARLAAVVRALARGDLGARAPEDGELLDLARAVNELAEAAQQREELYVVACRSAEGNLRTADTIAVRVTDERDRDRARFAATVRSMGLPLIEVAEGVLVVPVVGLLDSDRTASLMGDVLERCHRWRARHVILDLTGIDVVDTAAAAHLLRVASATELIGTGLLFTGLRAEIARAMVALGVELPVARTFRSVRAALASLRRAAH